MASVDKSESKLPIVDLSPFMQSKDSNVRKANANELVEACRIHGAVGVTGYGMSLQRLREAFEVIGKLFDLTHDDKMKAPHPEGRIPHRGYSPPGKESTHVYSEEELESESGEKYSTTNKALDWKEHYEIGSDDNTVNYNIWLPEEVLPGFRAFQTELFWELHRLGTRIMEALLLGLDLDPAAAEYFQEIHDGHESANRLLHYPSILESKLDRSAMTWCPAHTDFTAFTMLFQTEQSGLEFEDRQNPNTYIPAEKSCEDMMFMNIGDYLEAFSNGYLPASKHRVEIPPVSPLTHSTPDRYSMPFFVTPRMDKLITPQYDGKPGTMPRGVYKAKTVLEHLEFRMKFQYKG